MPRQIVPRAAYPACPRHTHPARGIPNGLSRG